MSTPERREARLAEQKAEQNYALHVAHGGAIEVLQAEMAAVQRKCCEIAATLEGTIEGAKMAIEKVVADADDDWTKSSAAIKELRDRAVSFFIDRDGDLVALRPSGATEKLGKVVGDPGLRGESIIGPPGPAGDRGPPGDRGPEGPSGKLPLVRAWSDDGIAHEGDVVVHLGCMWQARRDTGRPPVADGKDWTCLAVAGKDTRTITFRGAYKAEERYDQLDAVMVGGSTFVSTRSRPGPCPGEGWSLLAGVGKRGISGPAGPKGDRGERGVKGDDSASIASWQVDREGYTATPILSDGRVGPPLELRALFEQFKIEGG
jgi:hypothetical protein